MCPFRWDSYTFSHQTPPAYIIIGPILDLKLVPPIMSSNCTCSVPSPSPNLSIVATNGIQDVSALLPLLGTEQCEIHTLSALDRGFLYTAATPMSLFGSLGIAKAAFTTLWGSIEWKRLYGPRQLNNAGFQQRGVMEVLSSGMDLPNALSLGERKIWDILRRSKFTRVDINLSSTGWLVWNFKMMMFSVALGVFGFVPFVDVIVNGTEDKSFRATWMYPMIRIAGSILSGVMVQFILQFTILKRLYYRIRFMALNNHFKEEPKIIPVEWNWNPDNRSTLVLSDLRKQISKKEALEDADSEDSTEEEVTPKGVLELKLDDPMLQNLHSFISFGRNLPSAPASQPTKSIINRILTPLFPSLHLILARFVLLIGLVAAVVGYVGSFTIIQASNTTRGPLLWLFAEAMLSIIRVAIWAANPSWDDPPPPIAIEMTNDATYHVGWKLDGVTAADMHALIVGIDRLTYPGPLPDLKHAVSDAVKIQEYLQNTLAVPPEHIVSLHDSKATEKNIMREFRRLIDNASIRAGAPILIYFATHSEMISNGSFVEEGRKVTLIPSNFKMRETPESIQDPSASDGIPFDTIVNLLQELSERQSDNIVRVIPASLCHRNLSRRQVVVMDSCHAGALAGAGIETSRTMHEIHHLRTLDTRGSAPAPKARDNHPSFPMRRAMVAIRDGKE